jgi:hypothetical protein
MTVLKMSETHAQLILVSLFLSFDLSNLSYVTHLLLKGARETLVLKIQGLPKIKFQDSISPYVMTLYLCK